MREVAASNGGELHRYAIAVGVPDALKDSLKLEFGDEQFSLMEDEASGLTVLKDPRQDGTLPFSPSFAPHADEAGGPMESPTDHQKRMTELQDEDRFIKGFALGLGYGGLDMVKSTGETIVGAAKFIGRAHLQVGLRFTWAANWITGADNTETNELITQVDAAQGAVIDQGLALGKFLGTLLVDTATALGKAEIGLLTGDVELMRTALHGSETHRKIFEMASEAITQTVTDLGPQSSPGQKGYVIGKIVFEVASMLIPATKAGTLMQVTKSQVLQRLTSKAGLLRNGAHGVATAVKAAVDASQMCFVAGTPVLTKSGLMKIEDVHPGMWVWSRDEHSGAVAWKRVRHTFITHPSVIHHLTYELRGPPSSASVPLAGEAASQRLAPQTETLGVTAPHPFWVCNREQPAFIEAENLQAGDELLTADGRHAVVMDKSLEQAPAGRTFTTYNFEVEDFHTYFAGQSAVWVHNNNNGRDPCTVAISIFERFRKRNNGALWQPYHNTIGKIQHVKQPEILNQKVFNEARKKHFAESLTEPGPWLNRDGIHQTLSYAENGSPLAKSENLAANLERVLGYKKIPNSAAHHIIPKGEAGAAELRNLLRRYDIHPDDAANGTFMVSTNTRTQFGENSGWLDGLGPNHQNHGINSPYIQRLNEDLEPFFDLPKTPQNVELLKNELQRIASGLVSGNYPWP